VHVSEQTSPGIREFRARPRILYDSETWFVAYRLLFIVQYLSLIVYSSSFIGEKFMCSACLSADFARNERVPARTRTLYDSETWRWGRVGVYCLSFVIHYLLLIYHCLFIIHLLLIVYCLLSIVHCFWFILVYRSSFIVQG